MNRYSYESGVQTYQAAPSRADFLLKTYLTLFGAIVAFVLLEVAMFKSGIADQILSALVGTHWLLVLGAFMLVSWFASRMAHAAKSKLTQTAGLAFYVAAISIIFVPLLWYANRVAPGVIASAAIVTLGGFGLLTATVLLTRADFSFLRGIVFWGFTVALLLIVGSAIFGFQLGMFFSVAMVALAGASILYSTSTILHTYDDDRYIGAALQLFADVAIMFMYVLRIFLASRE
ncbi:MAG: US12 family protein [Phycisphaerales bacterium]|nr:US12 family protein [Phycisphaerales bacterium]